jgi:hypothetical protein
MALLKLKLILEVGVDSHDFSKVWTVHQLYFLREKLFISAILGISAATAIVKLGSLIFRSGFQLLKALKVMSNQ